jgi:GWxTD domain-containing protein
VKYINNRLLFSSMKYVALAMLIAFTHAIAQNPASELLRYGELAYAEALNLPSDRDGSSKVEVLIRVSYDFLIFNRSSKISADSLYSAGLELAIDVQRKDGEYVSSANEASTVYTREYATTNTRSDFVLIKKTFYLDSGRYVFKATIEDKKSTRKKKFILPLRVMPLDDRATLQLGSIIAAEHTETFSILGFGGRLLFTKPAMFVVPSSRTEGIEWRLRIEQDDGVYLREVFNSVILPDKVLKQYSSNAENGVVSDFKLLENDSAKASLVLFEPGIDTLPIGDYRFVIIAKSGSDVDSVSQKISVFWKEMPFSLYDANFATELMRYILTEDEYDEMTSGNDVEKRRKLRNYWAMNDPSPATPFNEHMYEYFRRVDESYYRFQTTKHLNGALTDRGKVFVLFGEPEETQRTLIPGEAAEEVWYYPSLNREFRFVDKERNSNYRLVN